MTDVTLVTGGAASADDLTEADYHDIYTEIREKTNLRQFAQEAGVYSFAWWSQFERYEKPCTWPARAALRRMVGLPALPLPVDVALSDAVDGDAQIYRIGPDGQAHRVLLLVTNEAVTVHWNGRGPHLVEDAQAPATADVTGVTAVKERTRYWRPTLPAGWHQRAERAGLDLRAVVLAAIEAAETDDRC